MMVLQISWRFHFLVLQEIAHCSNILLDAKAKALTKGIHEAIWLRTLSNKIHGIMPNLITIFCNNQSTFKAVRNPVYHE